MLAGRALQLLIYPAIYCETYVRAKRYRRGIAKEKEGDDV